MSQGATQTNYDRLGTRFSNRSWAQNDEIAKPIRSLTSSLSGNRWLEVGSGAGDFTRILSGPGRDIVGLDLSIGMLHGARTQVGLKSAVQGDVCRCPFESCTFDVVACRNVLKHCSDMSSAIVEMKRVCRSSGHLVVVESCVANELDRAFMNSVVAVTEPNQSPFLRPGEWVEALTDSRARLVSSTTFTHQVVSTPDYRVEQYGLSENQLEEHWKLFANAPEEIRGQKEIRQSSDGVLEFRLLWVAIVIQLMASPANSQEG
ncbi:class I SAM-dependent methyltransferase [Amycolatopsis sp. NPDC048633]|uniref:class I SAM-dependent methyltransferase n=1 Tax=Amycolatopsis sp. NPDC048633 TaxID=3157095 RepID=UPI00340A4487